MKITHADALKKIGDILKKSVFGKQLKFESGKLSDGTVIEYTALEPGGEINTKGEDDALVPAAVGEYELEDGRIIIVTEAGKIAEIKEAAAEEEMSSQKAGAKTTKAVPKTAAAAKTTPAAVKMAEGDATGAAGLDFTQAIEELKRSLTWQAERIAQLENTIKMFQGSAGEAFAAFQEYLEVDASTGSGAITKPRQTLFQDVKKLEEKRTSAIEAFKRFNKARGKKTA